MRAFRPFAAAGALLLTLAGGAILAAQPDSRLTRQREVSGWLVEEVAESDGGSMVRMSRTAGGARLQFSAVFWRGNHGRIQAVLVERSDCTNGEEIGRHVVLEAPALRALFAAALEDCAVSPRRIEAALAGIEPAYALAAAWADEAAAATAAEAQAIADYGNSGDTISD
ncbi:MAG: hypothetical protein ACT4N8_12945 [Sphingosinicella sp.]|uniref:hypothetical protein n=1 Tax=Sphingosinicella sp. TaxID=1917971 RepID=UPI004037B81E